MAEVLLSKRHPVRTSAEKMGCLWRWFLPLGGRGTKQGARGGRWKKPSALLSGTDQAVRYEEIEGTSTAGTSSSAEDDGSVTLTSHQSDVPLLHHHLGGSSDEYDSLLLLPDDSEQSTSNSKRLFQQPYSTSSVYIDEDDESILSLDPVLNVIVRKQFDETYFASGRNSGSGGKDVITRSIERASSPDLTTWSFPATSEAASVDPVAWQDRASMAVASLCCELRDVYSDEESGLQEEEGGSSAQSLSTNGTFLYLQKQLGQEMEAQVAEDEAFERKKLHPSCDVSYMIQAIESRPGDALLWPRATSSSFKSTIRSPNVPKSSGNQDISQDTKGSGGQRNKDRAPVRRETNDCGIDRCLRRDPRTPHPTLSLSSTPDFGRAGMKGAPSHRNLVDGPDYLMTTKSVAAFRRSRSVENGRVHRAPGSETKYLCPKMCYKSDELVDKSGGREPSELDLSSDSFGYHAELSRSSICNSEESDNTSTNTSDSDDHRVRVHGWRSHIDRIERIGHQDALSVGFSDSDDIRTITTNATPFTVNDQSSIVQSDIHTIGSTTTSSTVSKVGGIGHPDAWQCAEMAPPNVQPFASTRKNWRERLGLLASLKKVAALS